MSEEHLTELERRVDALERRMDVAEDAPRLFARALMTQFAARREPAADDARQLERAQ